MSDTVENETEPAVSTVVTKKDPKKVEQGKRLVAISREAKERKLREKIEAEYNDLNHNKRYTKYIYPVISVVSTFGFFYLWFSRSKSEANEIVENTQQQRSPPPQQQPPPPQPKKFETFE